MGGSVLALQFLFYALLDLPSVGLRSADGLGFIARLGSLHRRQPNLFEFEVMQGDWTAGQWVTGQVHLTWDKGQLTVDS